MSYYFTGRKTWFLLLLLSIALCVSACGKNTSTSRGQPSNAPLGIGTTPEPGRDGKPMPLPDGHFESMVASNGIDYVGSDNGRLYAPVTYVKATFSGNTGYDTALEAVNNLGFRLANPCYEQVRARGDKPTWKTAGQENAFGSAHTLLLATTGFNATTWLSQLKLLAGVTTVDIEVETGCQV